MAEPQAKMTANQERLAALSIVQGGTWATAARGAALDRLRAMGLPERRDEYWKFTRPDSLVQAEAPKAALFDNGDEPEVFGGVERLKIVFVDGVFDPEASDDLTLEGVRIERLAQAAQSDIHWAKDTYGLLEERGQTPVARPLAALNTALATDGVLIHVTAAASKPVNLIYVHKSESSDAILHHVVKLDADSALTVLENGPAAARFNKVMEVEIGDGATFHHVRTQGRDHER
ncbi:MAG: Fe-S cluster assembly protein SufD, partial [Roseovarius sp.]|nr:Fe-S cluster assembly protein SufD [Roseovarius sp.]